MRLEDEPWSGSAQYLLGSARVYLSRHGDMPRYEKYLAPLRAATLSALQIVTFKPYEGKGSGPLCVECRHATVGGPARR